MFIYFSQVTDIKPGRLNLVGHWQYKYYPFYYSQNPLEYLSICYPAY